mmetsp:Transcript_87692/g.263684  ORF Transcript_87692/g.263684 Transcript_87692/m.263684 type:complete len:193 (-) Transcript_87692:184-762(-)
MPRKTTDVSQQEGARQDEAPRMAWPGGKIVSNAAKASARYLERMSGNLDVLDDNLRTAIRAAAVQRSRWTREELNKKLSQGLRARLEELVNEYRHDPSPESRQRVRMIPNRPAEWQPLWVYIGRPSGGAANRLLAEECNNDDESGAAEGREATDEQEASEKDEIDFGPLACGIQAAYEKALEARTLRQPSKK